LAVTEFREDAIQFHGELSSFDLSGWTVRGGSRPSFRLAGRVCAGLVNSTPGIPFKRDSTAWIEPSGAEDKSLHRRAIQTIESPIEVPAAGN
jgi:hypothetical protein